MHLKKSTEFRISNSTFGILCTVPGLIALVALIGYPVVYNIIVSFSEYRYTPGPFIGLGNYRLLVAGSYFLTSLKIAALYSTGSTLLAFIVSIVLAEALHRISRGKALFRTVVILPWAVPLVLSGIIFKWMFDNEIGVVNYVLKASGIMNSNVPFLSTPSWALAVAIVATAYVYIPFMTVLIHAGLQTIPRELYEAAEIDGADELHKLRYITFPLNKYQMGISVLIVWLFTFRTPDLIFSLTRGGPGKTTYHIGLFLRDLIYKYVDFGRGAALGVVIFLVCLLAVAVFLLYFLWSVRRN